MPLLSASGRDLTHAVRSLAKARAFTFVCVASLGVGMGTVIAILMLVRAIVGTPALVNPEGLVELLVRTEGSVRSQSGGDMDSWTYPDFVDISGADPGLALSAWTFGDTVLRSSEDDTPTRVAAMYVSGNYFTTVGVSMARGPGFGATGPDATTPGVVIIEHDLWQNRLGGRADIVGTTITLNRVPHVVVGVTPARFRGHVGPEDSPDVRLWVPLHQHPRMRDSSNIRFNREADWLGVMGRVSPGTSLAQVSGRVSAVMSGLAERYPATNQHRTGAVVEPYHPMGARSRNEARSAQAVLFGLSGMVLFIVCLNVSGMMMVRAATRERELSVRLAIGASRSRLIQYILSEALVIAVLAGTLAVLIVFGVPVALLWFFDFWHRDLDLFRPDGWTFVMCVSLCFVTSLVFGLVPAIRFSRPNILSALKDDAGGGGRRVGRVHRWTAAIQAGIAVPFLVLGGVKLDQVRTAATADVGFEPIGLFAAPVDLSGGGMTEVGQQAPFLLKQITENLGATTGVQLTAVADGMPLDFRRRITRVFRQGDGTAVQAHTTRVDEHFFDTLGMRLIRGRGITREDRAGSALVVVLSESLAAQLFPGESAVGQRVTFALQGLSGEASGPNRQTLNAQSTATPIFTIVGVTADSVTSQMGTERPQIFVPIAQHVSRTVVLIARAGANESDAMMAASFKNAVAHVDPDFAPSSMTTGARLIRRSVVDLATHAIMSAVCAGVALTLAALGVYGVVGFMVATRTREIGIRMALGASRPRVLRTVLTDAISVVIPGVAIGLVLAIGLVRGANMAETWYALGGVEPLAYASAAAVATAVALLAGLPSARRAIKINPIQAMRSE